MAFHLPIHTSPRDRSSRDRDTHVKEDHDEELAKRVMTITPCEVASVLNFDRMCATIKQQPTPENGRHHNSFLIMIPALSTVEEALQTGADESVTSTDTDATTLSDSLNPLKKIVQTGSYLLSLDIPPTNPSAGWYFGRGRPTTKHGGVDFLLAEEQGIHSIQLVLNYSIYGQLCLWALHGNITLDGNALPKRRMVPLSRSQHSLRIGPLAYRLNYIVPPGSEELHHRLKGIYLETHHMMESPSTLLSATPRENDVFLGKWKLHGVVGVGGSSVFEAASHTEGDRVVAMKSLLRSSRATAMKADEEICLYKEIKNSLADSEQKHHVMQIEEVLYSSQPDWTPAQPDRVWLLYSPLGQTTLGTALSGELGSNTPAITCDMKKSFFVQILMGLSALHSAGWIHRDVKPPNITIVSFAPPRAVLIDLGQAIRVMSAPEPKPGTCGTVGYLAPELENPEYADRGYYTEAVDVWSLGAIALDMFASGNPWRGIRRNPFRRPENQKDIKACIQRLPPRESSTSDSLLGLIHRMIEFHATNRITLTEALAHPAISTVIKNKNVLTGIKRKRTSDSNRE